MLNLLYNRQWHYQTKISKPGMQLVFDCYALWWTLNLDAGEGEGKGPYKIFLQSKRQKLLYDVLFLRIDV